MPNQEHLDILKQGVETWNEWREEHDTILADLRKADLFEANLTAANLRSANLFEADLSFADLSGANLTAANLSGADLTAANLRKADLSNADLSNANLSAAHLEMANLTAARLEMANLIAANLTAANLTEAFVGGTIFGDVDLSTVKGLDTIEHDGPSTIGIDTIYRSHGSIPEIFLRKAGVQETFLTNMRELVDSMRPINFYSCFISYSSKDESFAERLYADLQSKGVRCWFAPEDMDIGDKIRPRIEESIRRYDKLLLVLSQYSIESKWVIYEVERALDKEPEGIPNVLYPIRLDNTIMQSKAGWAEDIRHTRHIGDFSNWTNPDDYQKAFNRLLRALKAEDQKMES